MAAKYSRLRKTQARKDARNAFFFGTLTIVVLIVFVWFAFPIIPRFTSFLGDASGRGPTNEAPTSVSRAPRLNDIPSVTNVDKIRIRGSADPGVTVAIHFNEDIKELISDSDGEFFSTFTLQKGENTVYVMATDTSETVESERHLILFDDEGPLLELITPENGKQFLGVDNRVKIEGQTERGATVTINERRVVVSRSGKFDDSQALVDGENKYLILVTDEAGNTTELELIVSYSP